MSRNRDRSVYIGNLDERVSDRILYDILIQAGRLVGLHIPRDKETDRPKGYAFAEYESEETANYAVMLFSGLVTLHNRTLKFALSGQEKHSPNIAITPLSTSNSSLKARLEPLSFEGMEHTQRLPTQSMSSAYPVNFSRGVMHQYNGSGTDFNGSPYYDYNGRDFVGTPPDRVNRKRLSRFDLSSPLSR